jgi:hypothetical protein
VSKDSEAERGIEALGGGLMIADGEYDSFQPRELCGALQHFGQQTVRDPLPTMLVVHEHAPNPAFVPLLNSRLASEPDSADQHFAGEGAQHIVLAVGSGQTFAEDMNRRGAMLLRRRSKGARFALQSFQTQPPEGIGILRAEGANLYSRCLGSHYLGRSTIIVLLAAVPLGCVLLGCAMAQTPAPDAAGQKKILADATDYAINHERSLPNFLCIQTTRRFQDIQGRDEWRPLDIIVERLAYFEHQEEYKVIEINGVASSIAHEKLGGASSSGEFGSVMKGIFAPETATEFTWQTWFTLRGRKMHVYAYQVAAAKSDYHVVVPEQGKDLVAAYHGLIFIDDRKHFIHRITLHADGIPPAYPIQDISLMLDYEYTRIGDADYLLPLNFELRSREGNVRIKNDVDYDQYRKFTADSSVSFGAGDDSSQPPPKK